MPKTFMMSAPPLPPENRHGDGDDQDDPQHDGQGVVVDAAGLEPAQAGRRGQVDPADAVDGPVDRPFVDGDGQPGDAADKRGRPVDQAIDDAPVEPRRDPAEGQDAPDEALDELCSRLAAAMQLDAHQLLRGVRRVTQRLDEAQAHGR